MSKRKFYWAGFSDNELFEEYDYGDGEAVAVPLYLRKKDARKRFQDVRKVTIVEVKK